MVLFSTKVGIVMNSSLLIYTLAFLTLFTAPLRADLTYLCREAPAWVSEEVREAVEPFLLPEEHPLWPILDEIFLSNPFRITESVDSLRRAGFKETGTSHTQNFHVMKHKKLKGWLLKIYTDDAEGETDWEHFVNRCKGAEIAALAIKTCKGEKYFKVPIKFIVPLPEHPDPIQNVRKKNFILIVENMRLLDSRKSHAIWASNKITSRFLNLFWRVVTLGGLADSFYIDNCAWSKDGRVAFVDTEQYHKWPIFYPKLFEQLSPLMKAHWRYLIDRGGP